VVGEEQKKGEGFVPAGKGKGGVKKLRREAKDASLDVIRMPAEMIQIRVLRMSSSFFLFY